MLSPSVESAKDEAPVLAAVAVVLPRRGRPANFWRLALQKFAVGPGRGGGGWVGVGGGGRWVAVKEQRLS